MILGDCLVKQINHENKLIESIMEEWLEPQTILLDMVLRQLLA